MVNELIATGNSASASNKTATNWCIIANEFINVNYLIRSHIKQGEWTMLIYYYIICPFITSIIQYFISHNNSVIVWVVTFWPFVALKLYQRYKRLIGYTREKNKRDDK